MCKWDNFVLLFNLNVFEIMILYIYIVYMIKFLIDIDLLDNSYKVDK